MIGPSRPKPDIKKKTAPDLARLKAAIQLIGAKEQIVEPWGKKESEGEEPPPGGIKIGPKEFDTEVKPVGNILTYRGKFTTLHILQPGGIFEIIDKKPREGCKVHFAECRTLLAMRVAKRYNRYVVGDSIDGKFKCHLINLEDKWKDYFVKLLPCQNCLDELDYKNFSKFFSERDKSESVRAIIKKIVEEFNYEEFFEENQPILRYRPLYTDKTYPKGGYPPNWSEISRRTREKHGWKCQECGVFCGEPKNRGLLHTHHKDGIKRRVIARNLQSLCIFCHYHKPYHGRMKLKQSDLNRLRRLQREQGIETTG